MAGVWLLPIFIIILGIIVTVVAFIIVIKQGKQGAKYDISPNQPIVFNLASPQFTDGYAVGILRNDKQRKNGAHLIEMYPMDYNQEWNQPKPELQAFVAHRDSITRLSKGDSSTRRDIIIIQPRTKYDLPPAMRDTTIGDWMTMEGQLAHLTKVFGKSITAGDQALYKMMTMFARGEMSSATLAQFKEEFDALRKIKSLSPPDEDKP